MFKVYCLFKWISKQTKSKGTNLLIHHIHSLQQKQQENEAALKLLPAQLAAIDQMSFDESQLALVEGLLAGNVFDWGAKEVAALLESQNFSFQQAQESLQGLCYCF